MADSRETLYQRIVLEKLQRRDLSDRMTIEDLRVARGIVNPWQLLQMRRLFLYRKPDVLIVERQEDMRLAALAAHWAAVGKIFLRKSDAQMVSDSLLNRLLFRKVLDRVVASDEAAKKSVLAQNPALIPDFKITVLGTSHLGTSRYARHDHSTQGEVVEPNRDRSLETWVSLLQSRDLRVH